MSIPVDNPRLLTLLRFSKRPRSGSTWRDVAHALEECYGPELTLADVIHHLAAAFADLACEPRFQSGRSTMAATELLLSPIKGLFSVEQFGASSLDAKYSVEEFYNAMVLYFVGQFSIANIGWCREWYDTDY